jgi:hypothetical protein
VKFLSIYKTAERNAPPSVEHIETMQKLVEEGQKAGWLLSTEGCLPSARGARVRSDGGKVTVTDGPFTETKSWSPASRFSRRLQGRKRSS